MPKLRLEQRIVNARVSQVGPDYCNLELEGGIEGRLPKDRADAELQERWEQLDGGERFKVFMLTPSTRDRGFWRVDQRWSRREANPWFVDRPARGTIVEGVVTRYVWEYGGIVESDCGIEAFLHRAQVPGAGFTPINEVLFVGDRVRGEVIRVDSAALQVVIDLQPVIRDAIAAVHVRRDSLRDQSVTAPEPQIPHPDLVLAEVRLWIVDDDAPMRQAMTEWLTPSLGELKVLSGARALQSMLAEGEPPSHILIDRDLRHPNEWDDCVAAVGAQDADIAVAACSARRGLLEGIAYPALAKPIDGAMLFQWLRGEEPASALERVEDSDDTARSPRWLDRVLDMDFRAQATGFLAVLCRDHGLLAAVWVEQVRPGFFDAIAHFGIKQDAIIRVQPSFGQTLAGNVIERRRHAQLEEIGALVDLLPSTPCGAFGLSLAEWALEDHGVVFLARSIPDETRQLLIHMGPALSALVRQREMAAHLQEVEPFAALGRFWSGYAHELRQSAATALVVARGIARWLPEDAAPLDRVFVGPVRERMRELVRAVDQLQTTASYELGRVRRRAPQRVRVVSAVENLITLVQAQLRHRAKEERSGRSLGEPLVWLAERPAADPEITLDAQALDQPLMNLLDNAIHQVQHRNDSGEIKIRVHIEPCDPDGLTLWVDVEDNGGRMDAIQRARLFRPRTSTRGDSGIGMGLYISKRLVEAIGGRLELVDCETVRWLKTVFRLRLPYRVQGVESDDQ